MCFPSFEFFSIWNEQWKPLNVSLNESLQECYKKETVLFVWTVLVRWWLSVFCRGHNPFDSQLTWRWTSPSVAVSLSLDLQFTFWFTEDEAAVGEDGVKSVSELSEAESSHCDDEVPPGTPAFTRPLTPSCSTFILFFISNNVFFLFVSEK